MRGLLRPPVPGTAPAAGGRLRVDARYRNERGPAEPVSAIELRVAVPGELTGVRAEAMRAVVAHRTVHNSITVPPRIDIRLEPAA